MESDINFQRVSWTLFDTKSVSARSDVRVSFFQRHNTGAGVTNMDIAGALPTCVSFEIERLELKVLLPDVTKTVLSSFPFAKVNFDVANKIYGEWPLHQMVHLHRETMKTTTPFGDKIIEKRFFRGVPIAKHLLLDPQVHFGLYVDFGETYLSISRNFFLCAMLHGVKIRPVQ